MHAKHALGALVVSLGFVVACGSAPPPAPAVPTTAAAKPGAPGAAQEAAKPAMMAKDAAAPPSPAAGAARAPDDEEQVPLPLGETGSYDLKPVALGSHLVVVVTGRWKSPAETLSKLAGFAKLPQNLVDEGVRSAVKEVVGSELHKLVDPAAFADVVSLDAPIDFVVAADTRKNAPEVLAVFSVGLTSLARARAAARVRKLPEIGPGIWRLQAEDGYGPQCALAAAAGRAPARLVCGDRERDLTELAAYAARTRPGEPDPNTDLRVEVTAKGLAKTYGRRLKSWLRGMPSLADELNQEVGLPAGDKTLVEAAQAVADEASVLIDEADGAELGLDVDANRGITLSGQVRFSGRSSWLVQSMLDSAPLAGPAPEIFWRLPGASEVASYGYGGDPARVEPILKTVRRVLEAVLAKQNVVSSLDARVLAGLLRDPLRKHAPFVWASGHFPAGTSAAPRKGGDPMLDAVGGSVGWTLLGIDDAPGPVRAYLEELVRVYNRGTLQAKLKGELGSDAKHLPVVKTGRAPASLGAGALAIEVVVPNLEPMQPPEPPSPAGGPPKTPAPVSLTFNVLLMADGGRTWVGLASDRDALAKLMVTTKAERSGADSLRGRPGLRELESGRHVSGGFSTLLSLTESVKPALLAASTTFGSAGPGAEVEKFLGVLAKMPNKGTTPIIMYGDVDASARPSSSLWMNVPKPTLDDFGHLVGAVVKMVTK
ncbi:MAG: hypothetical protein HY744_00625 [Deltaproteobacteria bacterium]|nr:hypothetical protein [Deltaproteobacteria bacterium]